MPDDQTPSVRLLSAAEVRPLRREVLRAGMATQDVAWPEDELLGVVHLGIVIGGEVVAVSTWIPHPPPCGLGIGEPAVQLRGMATRRAHQGRGLGSTLVVAGCALAAERGGASVWANARDAALRFYRRWGFAVHEPGFVDATTQLPHHRVSKALERGLTMPVEGPAPSPRGRRPADRAAGSDARSRARRT